jgi:hypothetical protein
VIDPSKSPRQQERERRRYEENVALGKALGRFFLGECSSRRVQKIRRARRAQAVAV